MFYDTQRIIRKNQKYEISKAYDTISKLENKGLSVPEMLEAIDILLKDKNTESQQSILERANNILKERLRDENKSIQADNSDDIRDISCPLLKYSQLQV